MVGFDQGEGINYLTADGVYNEASWLAAVQKLVSSNFRTDRAKNYIKKFVGFLYKDWGGDPDPAACPRYRGRTLQVWKSYFKK